MGLQGTLTKENLGFSMPSDGPLYPKPPYLYKGASMMVFAFITDGPSAARLLPQQAELTDPPTAGLVFATYPESSLGPYREVVLFLDAIYQKRSVKYGAHLYVTSDVAMAAGREMGGFPKKLAAIEFTGGPQYEARLERPAGRLLASGTLKVDQGHGAPFSPTFDYLTLRVIPSPTKDAPPSLAELLETDWVVSNGEVWKGEGSCELTGASEDDPLHLIPVVKLLGCQLVRGDLQVAANDRPRSEPL
jgi:acetoacetate decarboxylase